MPHQAANDSDNLNFQLLLLEILDAHPRGLITPEILDRVMEKAEERGWDELLKSSKSSLKRRVERNLAQLRETFGERLERDDACRPYRWRVIGQESLLPRFLQGDSQLALYFYLHQVRTRQLLPATQQEKLQGLEAGGQGLLLKEFTQLVRLLDKRLQVLPDALFPEVPETKPQVHDAVLEALREERKVSLTYRQPAGEKHFSEVLPVKLVVRHELLHLLVVESPEQDPLPLLLAMHRISSVELGSVSLGLGFEPDAVMQAWQGNRSAQQLVLWITEKLAEEMLDRPLGTGMQISPLGSEQGEHGGRFTYQVTTWITLSSRLTAWIQERHCELKVVAPRRWIQRFDQLAT